MNVTVKKGSVGPTVVKLQTLLKQTNIKKCNPGIIDGHFGNLTEKALMNYQAIKGLLVDGICGPLTWAVLDPEITKPKPAPPEATDALSIFNKTFNTAIKTATDLYNWFNKHGNYLYYLNDKFNNNTVTIRIKKGLGINCTDTAQYLKPILEAAGYEVRYVHGQVKCSGELYGHVWLQIKGLEFPEWVNYDVTAVTHHGTKRPIGQFICPQMVKILEFNPAWLGK